MRIKLDENLGAGLARVAQEAGHDTETVRGEGLSGTSDGELYRRCVREKRVLVTLDQDFGDIFRFPPEETEGILVLRPRRPLLPHLEAGLRSALAEAAKESLRGRLWIVETGRIRKHGTPNSRGS